MKKIGLVGGISWTSTLDYYKYINEGVNKKLGSLNSAECIIYSLNFSDIHAEGWDKSYDLILKACENLKRSGVDGLALCANTAHMYADKIQAEVDLPFINILTESANIIQNNGFKKIGLLATKFTMEMDFYKKEFDSLGLEVIIPNKQSTRDYIQQTLREELGIGIINPKTKEKYKEIIFELIANDADCIALACTELPMILSQEDFHIPVFDTTKIHADAIVKFILS